MMTPHREDYIKEIFNSNDKKEKLTNKKLAERLGVSPASTSEMIRKLINSGHVERNRTLGLTLTTKGQLEAKNLVRKHRLWEVFLVDHLGYSWTEVHADAEVLEHVTSDKLANGLNEFLGEPDKCPHGEVIYGNAIEVEDKTVSLNKLKVNDTGIFKKVRDTGELLEYLEFIEFDLEDTFKVVNILPFDGPMIIDVEGKEISVSTSASKEIYVLPLDL